MTYFIKSAVAEFSVLVSESFESRSDNTPQEQVVEPMKMSKPVSEKSDCKRTDEQCIKQ